MSVEAGIEVTESLDLDKPLVCEVVWVNEHGRKRPCGRPATHTGTGHAELDDHGEYTMLLCDRCIGIATFSVAKCKACEVPLLKNIRPL